MLFQKHGQKFVGQNFSSNKIFFGQNFRHKVKISSILSYECLCDEVHYWSLIEGTQVNKIYHCTSTDPQYLKCKITAYHSFTRFFCKPTSIKTTSLQCSLKQSTNLNLVSLKAYPKTAVDLLTNRNTCFLCYRPFCFVRNPCISQYD